MVNYSTQSQNELFANGNIYVPSEARSFLYRKCRLYGREDAFTCTEAQE